jgi:hypothetical protein
VTSKSDVPPGGQTIHGDLIDTLLATMMYFGKGDVIVHLMLSSEWKQTEAEIVGSFNM